MAALPYMPLYVADYLADAAHLTTIQHGAYLLLIMNYWQRGEPLPNDEARLAKIAGLSMKDWKYNRAAILEFFTVEDFLLVHKRIAHELSRVADKSLKSKKAAQASVQRRFGDRSTGVEPTDTDTDTEKERKKDGGDKSPTSYAFFGQTIKLKPSDLEKWRRTYHTIGDLEAELTTLDGWWESQPADRRKNWFHPTMGMLNRKHQENLAERANRRDDDRLTV
jgi:uncharacterized protein YdaU (DUF1376 family)